jgi:hypothetical protein
LRLLRIARRSFPSGKWPSSCLRMSLNFLHIKRMCRTVWRPSRQSHNGSRMSGTFRRKRKSLSPIFSVLSCTRMALCLLVRPSCSCSTFFDGAGECLNVVLPSVSCCQLLSQSLATFLQVRVLSVAWSVYRAGGSSALDPVAEPSRHPVASFAAMSAASFPSMPWCGGIHRTTTVCPLFCSGSTLAAICLRMYAPDLPSGLVRERIAA